MPVITKHVAINESEIREAIAEWIGRLSGGEGPKVSPSDIIFSSGDDDSPLGFAIFAEADF